mgnify:CR=1 FL=1
MGSRKALASAGAFCYVDEMSDFSYMPLPTLVIMVTSGVFGTIFDLMVQMPRNENEVKFTTIKTARVSDDIGESFIFELANWVVLP